MKKRTRHAGLVIAMLGLATLAFADDGYKGLKWGSDPSQAKAVFSNLDSEQQESSHPTWLNFLIVKNDYGQKWLSKYSDHAEDDVREIKNDRVTLYFYQNKFFAASSRIDRGDVSAVLAKLKKQNGDNSVNGEFPSRRVEDVIMRYYFWKRGLSRVLLLAEIFPPSSEVQEWEGTQLVYICDAILKDLRIKARQIVADEIRNENKEQQQRVDNVIN